MKILFHLFILSFIVTSCKQEVNKEAIFKKPTSVAEKISRAHGFENWKNVTEISFTFFGKRTWVWHPKTKDVQLIKENDTIHYNRKAIDSLVLQTDSAFINDKYWLLVPFQLIWDNTATISKPQQEVAPISKTNLNKITLTYPKEGGYTPGDAYDIYYGNNYIIREWVFRKGNNEKPSLITTFENYKTFKGIKIALDHKSADGKWNLKFTNITIK